MKKTLTFMLSLVFLSLVLTVEAEERSITGTKTYLDNSFAGPADTVGWVVSGDGLESSSNYNWKWYKNSTQYMKCGKSSKPNTSYTYTLTSPKIILTNRGADLSFRYVKAASASTLIVYVRHQGVRQVLLSDLLPTGSSSTWFEADASLSAYAGDTIQLEFEHTNINGYVYLDDIKLEEAPLCPTAKHLTLSHLQNTSVSFTWNNSTSNHYILLLSSVAQLDPSAAAPSEVLFQDTITATALNTTTLGGATWTYTKDQLQEGTPYYLYVKSNCSSDYKGYGVWSKALSFQTPCAAQPIPYTMNFEALSPGETPSCWMTSSSYETPPGVCNPLVGDVVNSTNVFSIANNMNSETMLVLPLFSGDVKDLMLSFQAKTDEENTSFQIGLTNDLTEAQNIVTLYNQTITNAWDTYTFFFQNTFSTLGTPYYIVLYMSSGKTASTDAFHVYLDDITVDAAPTCLYPLQVEISGIQEQTCTLTWVDKNTTLADYTIEYTADDGTAQTVNTTTKTHTLTGLSPDTEYSIRVRSNCDATNHSAYSSPQTIHTLKSPILVTAEEAGTENFEGATNAFTLLAGYSTNMWAVGTALAHSPSQAMYISGDFGSTYGTQEASSNSYAYAYAYVSIPQAGYYNISFSWKGLSSTDYNSYMYVFLTEPDKEIDPNSSWGTSEEGTTLLGDKLINTENEDWEKAKYRVNVPSGGLYRLVFFRKTYNSSSYLGDYTAVDDIKINYIACEAPTALTQTSLSMNSIGLAWQSTASLFTIKAFSTAIDLDSIDVTTVRPIATTTSSTTAVDVTGLSPASLYYFYVQAQCDATHRSDWVGPLVVVTDCDTKDLPYTYNFNSTIDGDIPLCWWIGTSDKTMVETTPTSHFDIDGTPILEFEGGSFAYAVLPQFNTPIAQSVLEFDYVSSNSYYSGDFIVGYITDVTDSSTFVPLDTLAHSTSVVHVQALFDTLDVTITGRIVIAETAGRGSYTIYGGAIDNVEVYQKPNCWPITALGQQINTQETGFTIHWTPSHLSASRHFKVEYGLVGFTPGSTDGSIINVTDTFCTLTGLEAGTSYEAYVSTDCGTLDGTSNAIKGTFKTLVSPADGSNYSCDFEDSTENMNWTMVHSIDKNAWEIGMQSSYEGNQGLYVVDRDDHLGYSEPNDNCWAYRLLHCTTGLYTVTLEYKCQGQTNDDYMNCIIVPEVYIPTAGENAGISKSSIPNGWFTGDPLQMNLQESWINYTFQFSIDEDTIITLAFHWANNSGGYYDPASVDNITVRRVNCFPAYEINLDSLSQTTANLVWGSDAYDHFEVIVDTVRHTPEDLDTLVSAIYSNSHVTSEAVNLTGLQAATTYYAYILNHCSTIEQSKWTSAFEFTTLCNTSALPFNEDFEKDEVNAVPICWTYFTGDDVKISRTQAFNLDQSLYLKTAEASSIKLALPMVNMPLPIEHYQLVFYAYRPSTSQEADLVIALNSAEDVSSTELNSIRMEPITIPASQAGLWKRIVVPFEHPTDLLTGQPITMGNEQIIFITIPGPAELYIDAIKMEEIPACGEPYDVAIDSVLDRSIYYHWNGPATDYEIQSISADKTDTVTRIVSGDTAIFSGLRPHTTYNIHVRSLCSNSHLSSWSQFLSFTTNCAIESLPFFEDCSTLSKGEMPACWDVVSQSDNEAWTSLKQTSEAYMSLNIERHYSSYDFTLSTPEIDLSTATHGTMFFDMKGSDYAATPTSLYIIDETTGLMDTLRSKLLFTTDWTHFEVNVQAYLGHLVRFKFMVQTIQYSTGQVYLDNIGVEDRLYVAPPTGLSVSSPTTNSIVVHVNSDPSASSHNVSVVPENDSFDPRTATMTSMTLPDSVLVTSLWPNTFYKVYAQALKGSFGSPWIGSARFNTSCSAQTLPLVEDFETLVNGVATLPLCWTIEGNVSASPLYPASGQGSLKISSSAKYITPEITDELNTAEVYFNAYATTTTSIVVSVCSYPLDLSPKIVLDTVTIGKDHAKVYNVDFTTIPSGYHYVVFENKGTSAAYLDNIIMRTYAPCRLPESFTLGNIEKGRTNILISDDETASYDIAYGLTQDMDIHHLTATLSQVSDSTWITGLSSNKPYTVFVRKNCGTTTGQWIGPLEFTSACTALTISDDHPYIEDFSTLTATTYSMPDCWASIHNTGTSIAPYAEQYLASSPYSPEVCIQAKSGLEDSLYIILPECSNALNTLRWQFALKLEDGSEYSSTDCCLELGALSDPADASTFVSFYRPMLSGLSSSSYSIFNIDLRYMDIPADHHYLAYRLSNSKHDFKINAIELSNDDDCAVPLISIDQIQDTAVTLGLHPIASSTHIDLVLRTEDGTYTDTILDLEAHLKSYTFTSLIPGHTYNVKARSSCGTTMSDWSKEITFIMPHAAVTTFPYACNFEDATENGKWNHPNGGLTNQWIIGHDVSGVKEGASGLYISDNNTMATYDITQPTFTWATRQLHMVPGSYTVSFMAKVGGQTSLDVLRAFVVDSKSQLLPCNYTKSTLDEFDDMTMTATTDPTGFIDLLGESRYISASDWALHSFHVVVTDTMDSQLAFLWRSNASYGTQPGACIDSITISYDDCPAPLQVNFVATKSDYIQVSCRDALEVDTIRLHYAIVLRDSSFESINTVVTASCLSGDTLTLSGLTESTPYDLYTARTCLDGSLGAWSEPIPFHTPVTAGTVPYFCGFEPNETESTAWIFYNDDTNAWVIDSMAPLTDKYSLYISNDHSKPAYSSSPVQYSYAVRTIHFEPGIYDFSFSWKCKGETSWDYMMVALTPNTFIPEGGNSDLNGTTLTYDMATPEGSILWGQFNWKNTPRTENETFSISVACDMNLIFAWKNNGSVGTDPGAIVDDITITKQSCAAPFDLHIEDFNSTSAILSWVSSAPSTHLTIRASGQLTPLVDTTVTDTSFVLHGLTPSSAYTCQAYSICSTTDISNISDLLSFTTPCATYTLPFNETFELNLSTPDCWHETRGLVNLDGMTPSSALSETSSSWSHDTKTTAPSPHQKLRIRGSNGEEWLITPLITLDKEATLFFDIALTDYKYWRSPDNEDGTDDKFAVLMSRDNGSTWQAISAWTATSGAGHTFYDLPSTYETQAITLPLSPDHAPILIAFYGESTKKNSDNEVHIDNIHINGLSRDTLVLYDTICQGYAYGRNGFSIPAEDVVTGTLTQMIAGDAHTNDQMKELHLFVKPHYDFFENATICQGQSYPFGTANLTASGEYLNTLSTVEGCDSVVHLTLTVTQLVVNIDTMICEGDYFEINETQISTSGLYSDTIRNAEGCDSVTNIHLTVLSTSSLLDSTICEGDAVTVGSATYTTTGTYIDSLKNVLGCDSIVTLNLTVIPSDTVYSGQMCPHSSYNFRGTILTTPGIYTDTVHDYMSSGCDYVYKLTLNETLPDTVEIADQFCEGRSSYNEYGFSINDPEEKAYTMTKTSEVTGCDSVTILHLSMIQTVYGTITQTICDNESYTFGGKDYYAAGTYEHTFLSTETGCDSIATLTLKVNPTYTVDVSDSITRGELPYTNLTLVVPVGTEVGKYDYTIESMTQAGCDSTIDLTLTITQNIGLENVTVGTLDFYPNVVKGGGDVTITTDFSASERQDMSIRLYDATGKLIATYQAQSAGTLSCTMPSVSGMYYLRLETKSGQTFSGKLIIL